MAGHYRYVPAQPSQQNAFGALAKDNNNEESIAATVATQVATLMYQSQLTQTTGANTIECQDQHMAQIAAVQGATHDTLHHVIAQLNALFLTQVRWAADNSKAAVEDILVGETVVLTPGIHWGFSPGRWISPRREFPSQYGHRHLSPGMFPPSPPGSFQGVLRGGPPPYHAPPPVMNGGYGQNRGYGITVQAQMHRPQYSNAVTHYANWNSCYSCGFDVPNNHTSMTCPTNLWKVLHHIGFNCQNAQQYINLGHPCCTKKRHKPQFPANV
jgi:hypothetical protein